jgi:MoaA/NifB/PqqE/SkfB family radical SAM enzyme
MKTPSLTSRVRRHVDLTNRARRPVEGDTPPFLVLFINSICNLTCDHCFYWRNLNQRNDLSFDEIEALSKDLGPIENLNLSGGEPFIRPDFAEIVKLFIRNNGVKQIYVPTNGYFTAKTEKALRSVLEEEDLLLFACELSLDGTQEYHNGFRGNKKSFQNAMETYGMMAELQKGDPRLRIHSISTATNQNIHEIHALTEYLFAECPAMDHHNLAVIRGDRKDPSLLAPSVEEYANLSQHIRSLWHPREADRYGAIVEPMLQWTKLETMKQQTQVVPCKAGVLTGVVYANGDVSVCELHEPLGNLRDAPFSELWNSQKARELRESIACKECWCTTEVFMWPSIVFHPPSLGRALVGSRAWKTPGPPPPSDGAGGPPARSEPLPVLTQIGERPTPE